MFKLVVLSSVLAFAAASPSALGAYGLGLAGLGWGGPLAAPLAAPWGASALAAPWGAHGLAGHGVALAAPAVAAAPVLGAYNYRGPLSLAPGQPANILAADGRPLDTLSVNLDRAAHYTARAVSGHGHLLKKRSAPLLAPAAWSHSARLDLSVAPLAGHLGVPAWGAAPLAWRAPIAPIAPWGVGPLGHAGVYGHLG